MLRALLVSAAVAALAVSACGQPAEPQNAAPAATPAPAAAAGPSPEEIAAALAALPAPYDAADYDAGRRVFAQCRSCHTINAGGNNLVGPNLHGVFTREIGAVEGFAYSQAVQDANFAWTPEQLDHWLQNPREFLPGNRMAFAGVRDETQRRNLIAYLMIETAR